MTKQAPTSEIHILSQYNAQCAEIKDLLKDEGFSDLHEHVSTVVSSQGEFLNLIKLTFVSGHRTIQ